MQKALPLAETLGARSQEEVESKCSSNRNSDLSVEIGPMGRTELEGKA